MNLFLENARKILSGSSPRKAYAIVERYLSSSLIDNSSVKKLPGVKMPLHISGTDSQSSIRVDFLYQDNGYHLSIMDLTSDPNARLPGESGVGYKTIYLLGATFLENNELVDPKTM